MKQQGASESFILGLIVLLLILWFLDPLFLVGFVLLVLFGPLIVGPVLAHAVGNAPALPNREGGKGDWSDEERNTWSRIIGGGKPREFWSPTANLGRVEEIWFLAVFWFASLMSDAQEQLVVGSAILGLGTWFAFKVVSGWQSVSSVIKFPEKLDKDCGVDELDFLRFRRQLGAWLNYRSTIGTILNVGLAAIVAAVLSKCR